MEKFNVLLHKISRDLRPDDLESLVHICGIDESRKAEVKNGHDLFKQLRHETRISEENVEYLKTILNTVKRCDLVRLVQEFEGLETTNDIEKDVNDGQTSSTDISSRPQRVQQPDNRLGGLNNEGDLMDRDGIATVEIAPCRRESNRSMTSEGTNQTPCCVINWPCLKIDCYKIHFCYVILTVVFLLGIVIVALCWYSGVPNVSEHLNAESSRKNAGLYVIIALVVIFPIFMFIVFYARKCWKTRHHTPVVILANEPVCRASFTMPKNDDPAPLVAPQTNRSCEEPTTSGHYARNSHMAGDTEPILSP